MSARGGGACSSFEILQKLDPKGQITSNIAAKSKIREEIKPSKRPRQNNADYDFLSGDFDKSFKNDPKFLIVSHNNPNKNLSELNPFHLRAALRAISTKIESMKMLKDGTLLMLVEDRRVAEQFTSKNSITLPLKIDLHKTLNICKGTIYSRSLINLTEEEILKGLRDANPKAGITGVRKFTKFNVNTNQKLATGVMCISFESFTPPKRINLAFETTEVRQWFPNPIRCRKCNKLGHLDLEDKPCRSGKTCPKCAAQIQENSQHHCTENDFKCINCEDRFPNEHAANSPTCPSYKEKKDILIIKTQKRCTYWEALREYEKSATYNMPKPLTRTTNDTSYAYMAKTNRITDKQNTDAQQTSKQPNNSMNKNEKIKIPTLAPISPIATTSTFLPTQPFRTSTPIQKSVTPVVTPVKELEVSMATTGDNDTYKENIQDLSGFSEIITTPRLFDNFMSNALAKINKDVVNISEDDINMYEGFQNKVQDDTDNSKNT